MVKKISIDAICKCELSLVLLEITLFSLSREFHELCRLVCMTALQLRHAEQNSLVFYEY